jgi:hypothetical protein
VIDEEASEDLKLCLYYLRTISRLVQYSDINAWSGLAAPLALKGTVRIASESGYYFFYFFFFFLRRLAGWLAD